MATKVLTKRTVKPAVEVDEDTDTETETKAEPKVIVTKALATLISNWDKAEKTAESYFPRVVAFVIENDTSREELREALLTIRKMAPLTANNEISVIMRVKDFPDEVQACIEGDDNPATEKPWQVRELRDLGKKKQEGGGRDPEDSFKKKVRNVAKYAIEEAQLELSDFIAECKSAYKEEHAKAEAREAKANNGEEGEDEGDTNE